MTDLKPLFPGQSVPELTLPLVNGTSWRLSEQKPENFTLAVFYRGLHCPICKGYLHGLGKMLSEFSTRGVNAIAISTDTEERAKKAHQEWDLGPLAVACGLPLEEARKWGLYVSTGRGLTSAGLEEPAMFAEPGLFLIRPDMTLYCASVQTMPFARPAFREVLGAVDFVLKNNYPPRGQVVSLSAA